MNEFIQEHLFAVIYSATYALSFILMQETEKHYTKSSVVSFKVTCQIMVFCIIPPVSWTLMGLYWHIILKGNRSKYL